MTVTKRVAAEQWGSVRQGVFFWVPFVTLELRASHPISQMGKLKPAEGAPTGRENSPLFSVMGGHSHTYSRLPLNVLCSQG